MGMTIEEAIHDTKVMKEYLEYRSEPRSEGLGVLIDIAYKYQKIQEIIGRYGASYDNSMTLAIKEILNGKVD